jgi:VanZ family protein
VLGIIAIAALGAVTAAATEQIQEVLGYRCYETKDMMADLIGIAAGAVAMMAYVALKTEQK